MCFNRAIRRADKKLPNKKQKEKEKGELWEMAIAQKKSAGASSKKSLLKYLQGHWQLYLMILPPIIMLLIFAYGPMYGILIAFKDYKVSQGIWGSAWAKNHGFYNFIKFFKNYNFWECIRNTLTLSLYSLLLSTP